jgi:acyl carrier protein
MKINYGGTEMLEENEIKERLKRMMVNRLELKISPEEIKDDEPLFGEGLGLDSVESLELVVGIEEEFGVVIEETEGIREKFYSVNTLATFIKELLEEKEGVK